MAKPRTTPAPDPGADGAAAYRRAQERAELAHRAWVKAGRPLTTAGSMGQEVPHPLWKILTDAERHAAQLREQARARHRGPSPSAVVQAEIGRSPAAKLRSVG